MSDQLVCPCCGHQIDATAPRSLLALRLSEAQRTVLAAFVDAYPRNVDNERLFSRLWGGCDDGGPLSADNIIAVHLTRIRKVIRPLGFDIVQTGAKTRVLRSIVSRSAAA